MSFKSIETSIDRVTSIPLDNERVVIQVRSQDMTYSVDLDSNYEDRNAYVVGLSRFIEETTILNSFTNTIEKGWNVHAATIYTWRNITHCIPTAPSDSGKDEFNECVLDVYEEPIQMLIDFYEYIINEAKPLFVQECMKASGSIQKKDILTPGILDGLCSFSDLFFCLDMLKDQKVSIKNDFTQFKRYGQLSKDYSSRHPILGDSDRLNNLSIFLAQTQYVIQLIKAEIHKIEFYAEVLAEVLDHVCHKIEEKQHFVPEEKFRLLRSIIAILNLLDSDKHPISKLDKQKKLNIQRIERVVRDTPFIPVIGDLHLNFPFQLRLLNSIDVSKHFVSQEFTNPKAMEAKYNLISILSSVEESYDSISVELAIGRSKLSQSANGSVRYGAALADSFNVEASRSIYKMTHEAFTMLARMTENLLLVNSYKMLIPATSVPQLDIADVDPYEARTRYNYTIQEKSAMVSLIGLTKSLFNQLNDMEVLLTPVILSHVYSEIQIFINKTIAEIINKVSKVGKNDVLRVMLNGIQSTCGDMVDNIQEVGTKRKQTMTKSSLPANMRCVGPLSTQLYTLGNLLRMIIKSKDFKKDIDSASVQAINDFSNKLNAFWALMNYSKTLRNSCNLSIFWYREFYLEMSRGNRIQYAIEASPPWIFALHVIQNSDSFLTEYLIYVLDLYNDSAQYALQYLKRKHLYDEIEAEVNLIFEHLVHHLSEKIYLHYKCVAASMYYAKSVKSHLQRFYKNGGFKETNETQIQYSPDHRYVTLLHQRCVQLLGREIDLTYLLAQRIIINIRNSLDTAIKVFESSSIDNIFEFDYLIEVTKLTHLILSEHLPLPPFDILFKEANNSVKSPISKTCMHVLSEFINDLLPNFAYCSINQRFVRGKVGLTINNQRPKLSNINTTHLFGTKNLTHAYATCAELFQGFVGNEHFTCIVKYIEYDGLALLIEQLIRFLTEMIPGKFADYITNLKAGVPSKISLPRFQYGISGVLNYYAANFENIIKYRDMYGKIFQTMREIGNAIIVVKCMEAALKHNEIFGCVYASVYQGIVPVGAPAGLKNSLTNSNTLFKFISEIQDKEEKCDVERAQAFATENLSFGLSFFDSVLYSIKNVLVGEPWTRQAPKNAVVAFDDCKDYYRVFSILCLCMVYVSAPNGTTIEQVFGDGLLWCGETIVALLGQTDLAEGLDFLYHALKVYDFENTEQSLMQGSSISKASISAKLTTTSAEDVNLDKYMIPRFRSIQGRRKAINAFLSRFIKSAYFSSVEQVKTFSTPTYSKNSA